MAYFRQHRTKELSSLLSGGAFFLASFAFLGASFAAQTDAPAPGGAAKSSVSGATEGQSDAEPGSEVGESPEEVLPFDLTRPSSTSLDNGLRVLFQETLDTPTVSVCTSIDAGSRRDPLSAPGAYRVLAEILKDGGYRSATQDYVALVASRGGVNEVEVTRDATTFCTTVPSGEVALALWVTAGRFTAGALSEQALKKAVESLAEEAEAKDAEVRTGRIPERLRKMAFLGSYEYGHPTLPHPDELEAISLETIRELHEQSYVAKRSVVVIAGGAKTQEAKSLLPVHLYAARPGEPSPRFFSVLTKQNTERFSMAEDRSAKTPAAWYGWVAPVGQEREAMDVALSILTSEKRLGRSLVGPGRAAKSLELHLDPEWDGHGLSRVEIVGSNSRSLGTIEKSFDTALRQLASVEPKAEEVTDAETQLRSLAGQRLITPLARARELSRGVMLGRSPQDILAPLAEGEVVTRITPKQVRLAALEMLSPVRRSAIEIYPKGWQDPWQKPMRQYHIVESGQTLGSIAAQHGTSVAVITKMNGISRNKPIYPGDKLRVPRSRKAKAKTPRSHQVRRGDTLSGLAHKYGVSVREIMGANGMGSKQTIRSGETLIIPWASKGGGKSKTKPGASSVKSDSHSSYKVKSGETLSGIAQKHGVSTVALARANGISHKAMVRVGQTLKMPPRGTGKSAAAAKALATYKVRRGDTLSGIAKKHGVTVAALTVANQMSRKSTLRPGQVLKIPQKN